MLMDAVKIGPLLVKYLWIILAITLVAAYFFMKWRTRDDKTQANFILNELSSSAMIYFFVWKFSYGLFHLNNVIEHPISLLYFNGGSMGVIAGLIVAISYLAYRAKKNRICFKLLFDTIIAGLFASYLVYHIAVLVFLQENIIYYGGQIIIALGLIAVLLKNQEKSIKKNLDLVVWFAIGQVVSMMLIPRNSVVLSFSIEQIAFVLIAFVAYFAESFIEKNE